MAIANGYIQEDASSIRRIVALGSLGFRYIISSQKLLMKCEVAQVVRYVKAILTCMF